MANVDLRYAVTRLPPPNNAPVKIHCPYHNDDVASMAVYPSNAYCFACGARRSPDQFLRDSGKRLQLPAVQDAPTRRLDQSELTTTIAAYQRKLGGQQRQWLYQRGLTDAVIDAARLGHAGTAYSIPLTDHDGTLYGLKYRRDEAVSSDGLRYWSKPGTATDKPYYPQSLDWQQTTGPVILCEGELDALLLTVYGVPAVSVSGGVNRAPTLMDGLLARHGGVVLCLDNDKAGLETTSKIMARHRDQPVHVVIPTQGKDITDTFQMHQVGRLLAGLRHAWKEAADEANCKPGR